jgi:hypothetical protein
LTKCPSPYKSYPDSIYRMSPEALDSEVAP